MITHYDIETIDTQEYSLIDLQSKLNKYQIKRKKSLSIILGLTTIQLIFYCISYIDTFSTTTNKILIGITIIDILVNLLIFTLILSALIFHKKIKKSQSLIITSYVIQIFYKFCVLIFFMIYEFVMFDIKNITFDKLTSVGSITYFIFSSGIILVMQFFFLILGLINSTNEHYKIFNNVVVLKIRNILSFLFISIITICYMILLYLIINICYVFNYENNICSNDLKKWLIILITSPYIGFVIKILCDNYLIAKNRSINCFYSLLFFIIRFVPIIVICLLLNKYPNILQIIISNYYSNLVLTDYLVKNYNTLNIN